MKSIDFNLMVAELVKEEPQVAEVLTDLGLGKLVSPEALQVMGNIMTIPRAAAMQGVDMGAVIAAFVEQGFSVINGNTAGGTEACSVTGHFDPSISLPDGHPLSLTWKRCWMFCRQNVQNMNHQKQSWLFGHYRNSMAYAHIMPKRKNC